MDPRLQKALNSDQVRLLL